MEAAAAAGTDNSVNFTAAVSEELPENRNTEFNANPKHMDTLSSTKLEFGSTDCQQRRQTNLLLSNQISSIPKECRLLSPLTDRANTSTPRFRFRPPVSRFSSYDYYLASAKSDTAAHTKFMHPSNSLCLADLSGSRCRSAITDVASSIQKGQFSLSGGSTSSGSFVRIKQQQNFHRYSRKSLHLKNIGKVTSDGSSSTKIWNMLPTVRRNRTVSEHSAIEKCRGDNGDDDDEGIIENLEDENSFRSRLLGTSSNSLISPSLPSTSTPSRLQSRQHKRHIAESVEDVETAKKMKEDVSMEEAEEQQEEEMDIEMAEQDVETGDKENRSSSRSSSKENEGSGRSSRASVHRSFSTSDVESQEAKKSTPQPPGELIVNYELETIRNTDVPSSAFASITSQTLANLMNSISKEEFMDRFILVDCRYPFEYNGGHIRGAYNLFDPSKLEQFFYPKDFEQRMKLMKKKPIFYCEFSQQRAPSIAHEFRSLDRQVNLSRYPYVDYPEMYLLQYGYRNFFIEHGRKLSHLFEPFGYVKMNDKAHAQELATYRFLRTRTIDSVYHSLARRRTSRQDAESAKAAGSSAMETDVIMQTPPRTLPRRLYLRSPESPSRFPDETESTPRARPYEERGRSRLRSCCRRLFSEGDGNEDRGPGPSTGNSK